jgi:hypothetical protein
VDLEAAVMERADPLLYVRQLKMALIIQVAEQVVQLITQQVVIKMLHLVALVLLLLKNLQLKVPLVYGV